VTSPEADETDPTPPEYEDFKRWFWGDFPDHAAQGSVRDFQKMWRAFQAGWRCRGAKLASRYNLQMKTAGGQMASITLAVVDREHTPPGFGIEWISDLACMHDPAVRQWVAEHEPESADGFIVVADPSWGSPGGFETLTFPVGERDEIVIAGLWLSFLARCVPAGIRVTVPPRAEGSLP
jgi:hypothetical protein